MIFQAVFQFFLQSFLHFINHFTVQINEEDESKASSRNSIHRQHGPREEDEDRNQEETKLTTSGTTVVQECPLLPYHYLLCLRDIRFESLFA